MYTAEARRIDKNTYDVFFGNQWSDHVRVRQNRAGTYRVSGMKVDHAVLRWLNGLLAHNMPITYGQDMQTMLFNNQGIK